MARVLSIAAGVLIALAGIAVVMVGAAYLVPHLFTMRMGRTPVIVFLVVLLGALQVRRWRGARTRQRNASGERGRGVSPIDLTSGT